MYNIIIAGVGGQGTVLASKLIAAAAMKKGCDVRTTETIGMAQRGGSVVSHVRIGDNTGEKIFSPLIPLGKADLLIAFEPAEAVRQFNFLSEQGALIVYNTEIQPAIKQSGYVYKGDAMTGYLKEKTRNNESKLLIIDGMRLAVGNAKTLNVAMLGAAAYAGVFPFEAEHLREVITEMMNERYVKMNLESYEKGRNL